MKHARVFISVKGNEQGARPTRSRRFEHASGYIRRELVERLLASPRAGIGISRWIFPRSTSNEIERLLKEMKKDNPPTPQQ